MQLTYSHGKSHGENTVRLVGASLWSLLTVSCNVFLMLECTSEYITVWSFALLFFFLFSQCLPIKGLGFVLGAYKCICKEGFYHPNIFSVNSFQSKCKSRESINNRGLLFILVRVIQWNPSVAALGLYNHLRSSSSLICHWWYSWGSCKTYPL